MHAAKCLPLRLEIKKARSRAHKMHRKQQMRQVPNERSTLSVCVCVCVYRKLDRNFDFLFRRWGVGLLGQISGGRGRSWISVLRIFENVVLLKS